MELDVALDRADIVALALPSHVVLDVVDDIMPLLTNGQVLLDLAKGLAPGKELVSNAIGQKLMATGGENPLAVMAGPTIAPELAAGVLTTALPGGCWVRPSSAAVIRLTRAPPPCWPR